jgi:cytoskeleton protein RodZ
VRNYARALGIDVGRALESLAETVPTGPAPEIVVPTQNIRFDPLGQRFANPYFRAWSVAGVAFLLALAATYWWIFVRPAPPAAAIAARKEAAMAQPVPQNLAAAPMPAPEPVFAREAPKEEVPPPAPPPVRVQAPAPRAEAAAFRPTKPADVVIPTEPVQAPRGTVGARTVRLRFKGSSWVEIKDRSGKVLLSKINEKGSEAEVSGRPPFTVVVGNAPDVTMLYEDREFPLEPHTKVAVARFTLE